MLRNLKSLSFLRVILLLTAAFFLGHTAAQVAERAAASKTGAPASANWGLSFQQEGQPPVGNATADELRKYDAYYVGDTSQNTIYLTLDAGYENGNTGLILDTLKKHGVTAAFFVVGSFVSDHPDLILRMEK